MNICVELEFCPKPKIYYNDCNGLFRLAKLQVTPLVNRTDRGWPQSMYTMGYLHHRSTKKLLELSILSTRGVGTVDQVDILSEYNKKRCIAQLKALESSVGNKKKPSKKHAAVLIPLCFVDCQPSIVFTLRSDKLRRQPGQISFPGGMVSSDDAGSIDTALRESEEELGLRSTDVDVWGSMLPLPSFRGDMQVTPILANVGKLDIHELSLNYDEVDTVFTRDILSLCSAKNFAQTTFKEGEVSSAYTLPIFLGGEHKIWGLTAVILHQTLNLIAPDLPKANIATFSPPPPLAPLDNDPNTTEV